MPKLTDRHVAALSCPPGQKDALFFDGTLRGFAVRVSSAGQRVFIFQYRSPTGVRRMPLGVFGTELTASQARSRAERLRGEVLSGADPVLVRRTARATAVEKAASARVATAEAAFTLGKLIGDWDRIHLSRMKASYRRDATARLRLHLASLIERAAGQITKAEAVLELDRIAVGAGETTARRVMGYARSAFNWACKRGTLAFNPFDGVPAIGRDVPRDRVLTSAEVGAIWNAASALGPVHGGFARLLLLTLARRDEIASMSWAELAPDLSTWTLPAERAKNRKAHIVHLSPAARRVLESVPRSVGSALVFQSSRGGQLNAFSYVARLLAKHSGVEGWRLHDFRRTGVTALAGMGFPPHVCDRLLNHTQGTIKGVAAIYQRHDFASERRAALDAWARYIVHSAEGAEAACGNVVTLRMMAAM